MGCSCRRYNKVTTCSRTEVAMSSIGRDWLAVIREVLRCQVVRTLEHNQTQFKLDTLVDWQPVKEIAHRRGNAIVFVPADYQSSCGVKDSLQLPRVDVVYTGEDVITVVDPVDNSSIHQSLGVKALVVPWGEGNLRPRRPPREYLGEYTS